MKSYEITVLMPVYNGEKYLKTAIESILSQTYSEFEFLIINDASTDNSRNIILSYQDERINLVDNEQNLGITKTLNRGLQLAKGKYIARMDCDDISLPNRLEKQLEYITKENVSFVGSYCKLFSDTKELKNMLTAPVYHNAILFHLCFRCCLVHSSMLFSKQAVIDLGGYDESKNYVEDYDLWCKAILNYKFVVIPKILHAYRENDSSISSRNKDIQLYNAYNVTCKLLTTMISSSVTDIEGMLDLIYYGSSLNFTEDLKDRAISIIEHLAIKLNKNTSLEVQNEINRIQKYFSKMVLHCEETNKENIYKKIRYEVYDYILKGYKNLNFVKKRNELTIIILSFNRVNMTEQCISSIINNSVIDCEIIVLDNASSKSTQKELKELDKKYSRLKVIFSDKNLGCGGGRTEALKYVKTKYVMFLDNDIEVTPSSLENMYDLIDETPDCVAVTSKMVFPNGCIQFNGLDYIINDNVISYHFIDDAKKFDAENTDGIKKIKWINGGSTIFKVDILLKYPFDKRLAKYYYEDFDWSLSNQKNGFSYYVCSNSILIHHHEMFYKKKDTNYNIIKTDLRNRVYPISIIYEKHKLIMSDLFCYYATLIGKPFNEIEEFLLKGLKEPKQISQFKSGGPSIIFNLKQLLKRLSQILITFNLKESLKRLPLIMKPYRIIKSILKIISINAKNILRG